MDAEVKSRENRNYHETLPPHPRVRRLFPARFHLGGGGGFLLPTTMIIEQIQNNGSTLQQDGCGITIDNGRFTASYNFQDVADVSWLIDRLDGIRNYMSRQTPEQNEEEIRNKFNEIRAMIGGRDENQ